MFLYWSPTSTSWWLSVSPEDAGDHAWSRGYLSFMNQPDQGIMSCAYAVQIGSE